MSKCIQVLPALFATALLFCSEQESPYSTDYTGTYSVSVTSEQLNGLYAFVPSSVSFSQKEPYTRFEIFTEPSGFIDTMHFRMYSAETFALYFTSPFTGMLGIIGQRPNSVIDTFRFPVRVKSPYRINGREIAFKNDTIRFTLEQIQTVTGQSNLKGVEWYADSSFLEQDIRGCSLLTGGMRNDSSLLIKALCVDNKGFRFCADSVVLRSIGEKPSVYNVSGPLFTLPNKPLEFLAELRSVPEDSGELVLAFSGDTVHKPIVFSDSTAAVSLLISKGIRNSSIISFTYHSYTFDCRSSIYEYYLPVNTTVFSLRFSNIPDSFLAGDSLVWRVEASKSDSSKALGGSYSWTAVLDGDTVANHVSALSDFGLRISNAGILLMYVQYRDTYGDTSQKISDSRTLFESSLSGLDRIISLPSELFTGQIVTLILPSIDCVSSFSVWSVDDSALNQSVEGCRASFRFENPGEHNVNAVLRTSTFEKEFSCKLLVRDGRPVIDSVAFDDTCYISSTGHAFSVFGSDPAQVQLDSFCLEMIKAEDTVRLFSANPVLTTAFDTLHVGKWEVKAKIRNENGLWSEMFTIQHELVVDRGAPCFLGITPDTANLGEPEFFTIKAFDPDGNIRKVFIDWGDGSQDSIGVNQSRIAVRFNHTYNKDDDTLPMLTVITDDSGNNREFRKSVFIHDGKPDVKIVARKFTYLDDTLRTAVHGDTLLTPLLSRSDGAINCMLTFEGDDRDGQAISYAVSWGEMDSVWNYQKSFWLFSQWSRYNPVSISSPALKIVGFCRDNDEKIDYDTFFVRTDAPPEPIQITYPSSLDTVRSRNFELIFDGGEDSSDGGEAVISIWLQHDFQNGKFSDKIMVHKSLVADCRTSEGRSIQIAIPQTVKNGLVKVIVEVKDSLYNATRNESVFNMFAY